MQNTDLNGFHVSCSHSEPWGGNKYHERLSRYAYMIRLGRAPGRQPHAGVQLDGSSRLQVRVSVRGRPESLVQEWAVKVNRRAWFSGRSRSTGGPGSEWVVKVDWIAQFSTPSGV